MTIGHTAAPYVRIVMDDGLAHEIDATAHSVPRRSEDNAASQVLNSSQAKAGVDANPATPGIRGDAEPVSRPASGRSLAATSELMDVTAGETAPSTPGAVAGAAQSVGSAGGLQALEVTTPLARILSHKTAPTADGSRPRCEKCGRGFYVCICNVPEPDVMAVEDMKLVMPELFGLPNGWSRIEL